MLPAVRLGENMPTRDEILRKDKPFLDAIKQGARGKNYLGDQDVIETLLRFHIHNAMEKIADSHSEQLQHRAIQEPAREIAAILLGMRKDNYVGVVGWNSPGSIDAFLAKWCGSSENEPRRRIEHAMVNMFSELLDVAEQANIPGILEEQVAWQVDAIVEKYALLCLGVDLPTQATMELKP